MSDRLPSRNKLRRNVCNLKLRRGETLIPIIRLNPPQGGLDSYNLNIRTGVGQEIFYRCVTLTNSIHRYAVH
jgi:hypothetical protein